MDERPDKHDYRWQVGNLNDDVRELEKTVVALSDELRSHWTHPTNPCLCSTCQVFARFKKQINRAEISELKRIKNEIMG